MLETAPAASCGQGECYSSKHPTSGHGLQGLGQVELLGKETRNREALD